MVLSLTDEQKRVLNKWRETDPALSAGQLKPDEKLLLGDILQSLIDDVAAGDAAAIAGSQLKSVERLFDRADTDIALVATSAVVDLLDPIPTGAVVLAYVLDVTENWTDGVAGTFAADLGDETDGQSIVAAGDIDGGIADLTAPLNRLVRLTAGEKLQLAINSSVNLSTATAGKLNVVVYYAVVDQTVLVAP